ncbi:hypothetical protein DFJ73DRAFT_761987 [Zopfochytrium polystomum]|nr:hypothetical protein DFJ73DRAFT_761987 [Zopfochytrium polystomum]
MSSLSNPTLRLSFNGVTLGVAAASLVTIVSAFAFKPSSSCPAELDRISIIAGFLTAAALIASSALILCGPKPSSSSSAGRWSTGFRGFALGVAVLDVVVVVAAVAMRSACSFDMDRMATISSVFLAAVLMGLAWLIVAGRGSSTAASDSA